MAGTAPSPCILLVEDYDALGIALGTALKKFAPLHTICRARTLPEALELAASARPELFVLDFDPPLEGATAFLSELKSRYAEARLLVIAATHARELAAEPGWRGAIRFIEKPFELEEFGAAVQGLIGAAGLPPAENYRGTLRDLHVVDVVQLKCLSGATAIVELAAPDGSVGAIHFLHGEICHATAPKHAGIEALHEIVRWRGGQLRELERPVDAPKTIEGEWQVLLLDAVRKASEAEPARPRATPIPPPVRKPAGPKIAIIDDTEMLLRFAEEILGSSDRNFQLSTAATGEAGLQLVRAVQPDLLLLDYSLPDINGDEVCRRLLMSAETAKIPVLMMSGDITAMERVAAEFRNVVATLAKPFLSTSLIAAVEEALGRKVRPEERKSAVASPPILPATSILPAAKPGVAGVSAPTLELPPAIPMPRVMLPEIAPARNGGASSRLPDPPPALRLPLPPMPAPTAAKIEETPLPVLAISPAPVSANGHPDVLLTLTFDIVSMQLTPLLRMGALQLKPRPDSAGLRLPPSEGTAALALHPGFKLGSVRAGTSSMMETVRLIPATAPEPPRAAPPSFQIEGLRMVPANAHHNVQLTSAPETPLAVQLAARFQLATVELSPTFQVSALVLKARDNSVRVLLGHEPADGAVFDSAPAFEITSAAMSDTAELQLVNLKPAGEPAVA